MTDEEPPPYAVPAPWGADVVAKLNAFQRAGTVKVFMHRTDDHQATLVAEEHGWVCPEPDCGFVRTWTPHWTLWNLATPGIPYPGEEPRRIGLGTLVARMRASRRVELEERDVLLRQIAHLEGRVEGLIRHAQSQAETIRALEAHTDTTCDAVRERDQLRKALRDTVAMLRAQNGAAA